jgi:D-amino-acid dehydrogenase
MTLNKADVMVLGAGMVGVSAALHLQARGRDVVLIDRHDAAGEETSYGNAGLIERSAIFPYMFPRDLGSILRYGLNRSPEAHYHLSALPALAPWLWRYFHCSTPAGTLRSAQAMRPLIEHCLTEHEALMRAADATHLCRNVGWLKLFRSPRSLANGLEDAEKLKSLGVRVEMLDPKQIAEAEPHLTGEFQGGALWKDTAAVSDPGGLAKAYATLFTARGGRFRAGDAATLREQAGGWSLTTAEGPLQAAEAVVALGPWADVVFGPLGYRIPLGIKRGYHRHYRARGNAVLNHPIQDADNGYVLAPMTRGIRLTTGAEFARRDAPATPVQLERTEAAARRLFPLDSGIEAVPWMGGRPCLPDMLPVIGAAGRHRGLWLDFGHQHLGFTLGPVSGRLLAEMMTGETPFTDPAPYAAARFG